MRSSDEIGELAGAFNAMVAELGRAQKALINAAKLAFIGEVAAGIVHEVRTPLGILRSSAQILLRSAPDDRPQTRELLGMIIAEVDRLDRVVEGLLQLARPHTPQLRLRGCFLLLSRNPAKTCRSPAPIAQGFARHRSSSA